jgi:hypothetical protein
VGLFSTVTGASPLNDDSLPALGLGVSGIAFRYSTVVPDAGWVAVCSNGTTQTVSTPLAPIAASTTYKFAIRVDSPAGIVYFSINDATEVAVTATLPALATDLGFASIAYTQTGAARSWLVNRAVCRYGS